jgi:pimeloyl-ACP methyl ester carboxylesterase
LLLHGKGASRSRMAPLMHWLADQGHGVLAVSLRAHGDSTGTRDDVGWSARHDVIAAVEFIEQRVPGGRIVACGTSLGSAAAVFAAGELQARVHGYVLDCPYVDLRTAVRNRTSAYLPPVLDQLTYASLRMWAAAFLPVDIARISPRDHLADIPADVPVLILAGGADRLSPVEQCKQMADTVAAHGRLVVFAHVGHSRLYARAPEKYRRVLGEMLRQVEDEPPAGPGRV